jgi:cytoskeletal protein RodZ
MPIAVRCACGKEYHFKDQYAGRRAKCPACGQVVRIPGTRPPGTLKPHRPSREASTESEQSRTVVLAALGFAGFVILVGIGLVVYFLFFSGSAPRAAKPAAPSPDTQQPSAAASQGPAPASGPPAPAPAPNPAPAAPETPPAASPPADPKPPDAAPAATEVKPPVTAAPATIEAKPPSPAPAAGPAVPPAPAPGPS